MFFLTAELCIVVQETIGDIASRLVRRNPTAAGYKMTLSDGKVLGLPEGMNGAPLDSR